MTIDEWDAIVHGKRKKGNTQETRSITNSIPCYEMCDVCGRNGPDVIRTTFAYHTCNVVIRHHPYCDAVSYFNMAFR